MEIGVDRGVTLIPLVTFLAHNCRTFLYTGVDVELQESLCITLQYMDDRVRGSTYLFHENSLTFLPRAVELGFQYDLILLDGDHNYHTVSKELEHMLPLMKRGAILLIDDYAGKWADRDLWYAQRPGYEANGLTTSPVATEKQGVRPAVDEWLEKNPALKRYSPLGGEPLLVTELDLSWEK